MILGLFLNIVLAMWRHYYCILVLDLYSNNVRVHILDFTSIAYIRVPLFKSLAFLSLI